MRSAALVLCCSTAVALAPANYQILRRATVLRRAVEPDPRTVDGRRSARAKEPAPAREAAGQAFGFAPPLTVNKWETMQAKRVRLEVLYSRDVDVDGDEFEGLRKAYLRTKRIVQETYPDVLVVGVQKATRRGDDPTFEVTVDNKLVYAKPRDREGIYLSQRTLHREIMRARKARRPSTTYYRLEAVDDDDDDEYPRVVVPDK